MRVSYTGQMKQFKRVIRHRLLLMTDIISFMACSTDLIDLLLELLSIACCIVLCNATEANCSKTECYCYLYVTIKTFERIKERKVENKKNRGFTLSS